MVSFLTRGKKFGGCSWKSSAVVFSRSLYQNPFLNYDIDQTMLQASTVRSERGCHPISTRVLREGGQACSIPLQSFQTSFATACTRRCIHSRGFVGPRSKRDITITVTGLHKLQSNEMRMFLIFKALEVLKLIQ